MRFGRLVLVLALFQTLAIPAWSQDPDPSLAIMSDNPTEQDLPGSPSRVGGNPISELTLTEAFSLVLADNPRLAATTDEVRAKEAAAIQAGLLPNPEFAVEVENFGGKDEMKGIDSAETTFSLSQLLELGGKRGNRQALAKAETSMATIDLLKERLDLLAKTAKAFIQVLAAQRQLVQAEDLVKISEATLAAVSAKVEAGKVPPTEKIRAAVELATARTDAGRASRDLAATRQGLASLWGADFPGFVRTVGNLADIGPLPEAEAFLSRLSNNPDLVLWDNKLEQRQAELALARSQGVPDMTLSLGVRNFQESSSNALVAGLEFPLPLFNRNQGGIRESMARTSQAGHERRAAEINLRTELLETWQSLAASHQQVTDLRDEILPGAQSAFESTEYGFREGKFDFLQLLDAQRTLFDVKGQYLKALETYHLTRIETERLAGGPFHDLPSMVNLTQPDIEVNR